MDPKKLQEILREKQFAQLANAPIPKKTDSFQAAPQQSFVRNWLRPGSGTKTLMAIHATGTGKTMAGLLTANYFIKEYKQIEKKFIRFLIK